MTMHAEFGSVGAFMSEFPSMVMLVDETGVTISSLSANDARAWADYVRHDEMWTDEHVPTGYPVSSLFRSPYTALEAHTLTQQSRPRYVEMLNELASHGETHTVFVPSP